jgi:hypothetical protein
MAARHQRPPSPSARLTWPEIRANATRFAAAWHDADREAADKQIFWHELFAVFGLSSVAVGAFEEKIATVSGGRGFIDYFWKGVVLVEHKSRGEDLDQAQQQAMHYVHNLAADGRVNELPRFVVLCDFARFRIIDLDANSDVGAKNSPLAEGWPRNGRGISALKENSAQNVEESACHCARPLSTPATPRTVGHLSASGELSVPRVTEFPLSDLPKNVREFAFLVGEQRVTGSAELAANNRAAQLLADLHDSLSATNYPRRELERYLVRLLFCLFAEDTFIFEPFSFSELICHTEPANLGGRLAELWWTLDTAPADRQRNPAFDAFPHVNGGLFADRLPVCHFADEQRAALLRCCDYQWAKISPAIFGSLFQGVMEPKERRQLGAHYTGERDIMKLLNALFLDDLRAELRLIVSDRSSRRDARLREFQQKLRAIKILDPACGCGNFLILAYRELRALETAALVARHRTADSHLQTELDIRHLARVDVDQFYGIEISEWPARIAEVGLWLQDHQSNSELAEKLGQHFNRLPLKAAPIIRVANALTLDWAEILPPSAYSYILGNPPFVGAKFQTAAQRAELAAADGDFDGAGLLDYVTAWYFKAARYM